VVAEVVKEQVQLHHQRLLVVLLVDQAVGVHILDQLIQVFLEEQEIHLLQLLHKDLMEAMDLDLVVAVLVVEEVELPQLVQTQNQVAIVVKVDQVVQELQQVFQDPLQLTLVAGAVVETNQLIRQQEDQEQVELVVVEQVQIEPVLQTE
jgi:hypothetical protein